MKLLIISGRSGSGKSTALHILEDQDYYCIDNLPASLLQSLVARIFNDETLISKVAVSIDARNISLDLQQVPSIVGKLRAQNIHTEIIFLNANSQTLLNRFSESRRKHPLSNAQTSLDEAISKESELLEPIALMANLSIDTSAMSLNTLQDTVKSNVIEDRAPSLALLLESFGYKNGIPINADIVFDIRCLPNPYWDNSLRILTGLDKRVQIYLDSQQHVEDMFIDISKFLQKWLPQFENNNRSYITVALGCTGGQHRSVYLCERLGRFFERIIEKVQVRHRELTI